MAGHWNKTGWNNLFVCDGMLREYAYELQDFVEFVAYGKTPILGFELAYKTIRIIYAAYQFASEGRRIKL